jgi:hypothetical protein
VDGSDGLAVAEVHDAVGEPALVHQLELGAHVPRQRRLASTDDHGTDEQVILIDQVALEPRFPGGSGARERAITVPFNGT